VSQIPRLGFFGGQEEVAAKSLASWHRIEAPANGREWPLNLLCSLYPFGICDLYRLKHTHTPL